VGGPTIYQGDFPLPLNNPSDMEGIIPGNTRKGLYDSSLCWFPPVSLLWQLWDYWRMGSCRCRWSMGKFSFAGADSSSELVDPLSYSSSSLSTLSCYLNIMNLSLAHAPVAWDPRIFAAEAKLLPHKLLPSLIIQLLLALPFSLEWLPVSIPLGHKWFGESFSLWH
jgi:hypothetical protein